MSLLAIDPGYTQSAWVWYANGRPQRFGIALNADVLRVIDGIGWAGLCSADDEPMLAIESIASYGMAVGAEVFETCVWSGRFLQRWADMHPGNGARRVFRRDVKLHLCGSARAKDANVRQALIDRYGPGKEKAIGLKASPGPLYGVKADIWAALAVAVTTADTGAA